MNRKKYILSSFLLLILSINLYVYFTHFKNNKESVSSFVAVSERTTAFVYTNNLDSLARKLDSLSYLPTLNSSVVFAKLIKHIQFTDSVFTESIDGFPSIDNVLFALNNSGSSKLTLTTTIAFDKTIKVALVNKFFNSQDYKLTDYKFQDYKIYTINNFFDDKNYSFALYNNLFIGSTNTPLIEEVLNSFSNSNSKTQKEGFKNLNSFSDNSADLNLFIDKSKITDLQSILFSNSFINLSKSSENFANWSLYNVSLENQSIDFTCHYSNSNSREYNSLSNSESSSFSLDNFLPNNTAYFEAICTKNNASFFNKEITYSFFKNWIDEEAAFFVLESFDEDFLNRSGFVLKANNIDSAKVNMYLLNKEMTPVQTFDGQAIYEMNVDVLSKLAKSDLFEFKRPFFAFVGSYVVFANEVNVLRVCIQKFKSNNVLAKTENYKLDTLDNANKLIYFNPQKFNHTLKSIFLDNIFPSEIGKFNMNYYSKDGSIYAKGRIKMAQETVKRTQSIWNVVLDENSSFKPQIVINENNQRKEIITQDQNNTIYLISQSGNIVLKKEFDEQILGDIYQIDLYKANKLYYVFNTKKHIYALKRNGSIVDGYPIKLPTDAVNSIKVVNYDKANNYRFFIACSNQKVYGYEASGKPLDGWSPLGSFGNVSTDINYRVFKGKDYIYFNNDEGTFYAFNRKGEPRFEAIGFATPFKNSYERTKNGFINFSKGSVYIIDLNGSTTVKIIADTSFVNFTNFSDKDAFAISNNSEFRLAKSKWTILGKKKLNDKILSFKKINIQGETWFLVHCSKSIYLINEMGEIHPDFPMLSDSEARLSSFYLSKNKILILNQGKKLKAFELVLDN